MPNCAPPPTRYAAAASSEVTYMEDVEQTRSWATNKAAKGACQKPSVRNIRHVQKHCRSNNPGNQTRKSYEGRCLNIHHREAAKKKGRSIKTLGPKRLLEVTAKRQRSQRKEHLTEWQHQTQRQNHRKTASNVTHPLRAHRIQHRCSGGTQGGKQSSCAGP